MNTSFRILFAAGLLAVPALAAHARVERTIERTFQVQAAGTLFVDVHGGTIRVDPSDDSMAKVTAKLKIRADSESEADDLLKKLEITTEQTGNDIRVTSRYERQGRGISFGFSPPVHVDFVISVPAAFATDLRTAGGAIVVGNLNGRVKAFTAGGSIKLGRIGAPVHARTSGGSITLGSAGGPVDLGTSGGSITVGQVNGRAQLTTTGGGIRIDSAEGGVRAKTSGGSIRAGIAGPLQEDSDLSTSGGSVRVTVDPTAAFRLDASSSGGGVDAEGVTLAMDSSRSRSRLSGNVNGGGALLKLRSSGGSVSVHAR